jgi:hypothetical protein
VTVERITGQTIALGQGWINGSDIYWTEGRPMEGGRNALVKLSAGSGPVDCLPPEYNVRTRVHEYGGGAYAVSEGVVYFVHFLDQHLYRQRPGGRPEALAATEGHRFADFEVDPRRQRLLCVREDHTGQGEAVNSLVAIPFDGSGARMLV